MSSSSTALRKTIWDGQKWRTSHVDLARSTAIDDEDHVEFVMPFLIQSLNSFLSHAFVMLFWSHSSAFLLFCFKADVIYDRAYFFRWADGLKEYVARFIYFIYRTECLRIVSLTYNDCGSPNEVQQSHDQEMHAIEKRKALVKLYVCST